MYRGGQVAVEWLRLSVGVVRWPGGQSVCVIEGAEAGKWCVSVGGNVSQSGKEVCL